MATTYLQWKEKRSLFHRRRRVHTISITLSILRVIIKDNSSVRNMVQILVSASDLQSVLIWQSRGCQWQISRQVTCRFTFMHPISRISNEA